MKLGILIKSNGNFNAFAMLFSVLLLCLTPAGPVPDELAAAWHLDPLYTQHRAVHGLPIVASSKVHPMALDEAAWLIEHMIGHRPDVLQAMQVHQVWRQQLHQP